MKMGEIGTRHGISTVKVGEGLGGEGRDQGAVANGIYLVPEGHHDEEE